jgi:hypothetical protein
MLKILICFGFEFNRFFLSGYGCNKEIKIKKFNL